MPLLDTHYHLDFIEDAAARLELVSLLDAAGTHLVAQTVLPSTYPSLVESLSPLQGRGNPCSRVSLGFHPWWIGDPQQVASELAQFQDLVPKTRYIGEIGLDYAPRRLDQVFADRQRQVFKALVDAVYREATRRPASERTAAPYVLSIHTVRSAGDVLNILSQFPLEEAGVVPILHHFKGTSDELTRHIRLGGYLSVHPQMLQTKKGRAYVQQVPADRLLLETDLPGEPGWHPTGEQIQSHCQQVDQTLQQTVSNLSDLRGEDMTQQLQTNQARLYGAN